MGAERNIDWLPAAHAPAGDAARNILVYGTAPQTSEPPSQAPQTFLMMR